MALELEKRTPIGSIQPRRRSEPARLDFIQLGREVFTDIAQRHEMTYEEAAGHISTSTRRARMRRKVIDEYLKVAMSVPLALTLQEQATVLKTSPGGVAKDINRVLNEAFGLNSH